MCHLLSIYSNSATYEHKFLMLGWLFKRHLNLKLKTLELMSKLILIGNQILGQNLVTMKLIRRETYILVMMK
jgi:hypothetical protein